jgi:hypothetical protein
MWLLKTVGAAFCNTSAEAEDPVCSQYAVGGYAHYDERLVTVLVAGHSLLDGVIHGSSLQRSRMFGTELMRLIEASLGFGCWPPQWLVGCWINVGLML